MSRRSLALLAVLVAAAAGTVFALRGGSEPATDEERIRALLDGAARAAEERRVGDAVEAVSERFRGGGLDRDGVNFEATYAWIKRRDPSRPPERSSDPMTRRSAVLLLVLAGAAAGAVLALRLGGGPDSDEERIRALLDGAARAAEEKRVGDAVEVVSERFRGGGLDRQGVKQLVAYHVLRGEWTSASVTGAAIAVRGDAARANVDVVLARGGARGKPLDALVPGEASAHRFALRLEREPAGWRIVEAEWRAVGLGDALAGPPEPGEP
jgi:hypothetical protein